MEFVTVTETWLNDEVVNQLIQVNKYNIFRNDRSHVRGGGVCAFVCTDIPSTRRKDLENPAFECLWLWMRPYRLPRQLTGLICCVLYNPPDTLVNEQMELSSYIIQQLDRIRAIHPDCGVVILGDFNNLNIRDILCHHSLKQIADIPTRREYIGLNYYQSSKLLL